ncbi:hypothetical protein ACQE3E_06665 [Methylomonas sp. MED-D]|uniref:hypothetical protein n=1 Tax=Methylomonas sp. MED-D TaxID=3418768 RepID=UPI003D072C49
MNEKNNLIDELCKAWGVRAAALRCAANAGGLVGEELRLRIARGDEVLRCLGEIRAVLTLLEIGETK